MYQKSYLNRKDQMMLIKKQDFSLPIRNFDISKKEHQKHGIIFGGNCKRGLIIGPSGCGKTNLILSLLTDINGLRFENVYVYSKSLGQAKYEYLRKLFASLKYIG